ncbi:MAG: hypothetical protein R3Y62_00940 [Eubacteriales bacterium]
METFLEDLAEKLTTGGIRAMVEKPYRIAPRLKAPLTAVAIGSVVQKDHQFTPGGSRHLAVTAKFTVSSPSELGGSACASEALALLNLLMGDFAPWTVGTCNMGACAYNASADQYSCAVTAELEAVVCWTPEADATVFTDFILEGELL